MNKPVKLPPYKVERLISSLADSEVIDWGLKMLNVPQIWRETEGEGIRIAIIDTAGTSKHPDLQGAILNDLCADFTGDGLEDTGTNHGGFVAGVCAARRDGRGTCGVAPKAQLIFLRALDNSGAGSIEAVNAALRRCLEMDPPPHIVNMSLGMPNPDPEMEKLIKQLYARNIVCTCAAGNDGRDDSVNYPAAFPECVSVGGFGKDGKIAAFSSRGDRVDIAAPAVGIYSIYGNNGYARLNGTSFSSPFCASVCALLLAKHTKQEKETGKNDCKTVEQIREHLRRHAMEQADKKAFGAGIINPIKSVMDDTPIATGLPWNKADFTLEADYTVFSGYGMRNFVSPDGWLEVKNGIWTIKAGYRFDGCSNVPDGDIDPETGLPRTYYGSLTHDISYHYLRICPETFPYSKAEIDWLFYKQLKAAKFRWAWLYYLGVKIFGIFAVKNKK